MKKAKPVPGKRAKSSQRLKGGAKKESPRKKPARPRTTSAPSNQRVTFTNVDKVWFPEAGITKGDVLHYYLNVADRLLPHLRDRPITLERLPDGVGEGKPRFWQKNTPDYYPDWIPRFALTNNEGKVVHYALVNDPSTLAYLVNQGAITFHPFFSTASKIDRPTHVVFDLDPGEAEFADVVAIARALHEILDAQGVPNVPKTSGKSGLHVTVPWRQPGGFDEARRWAEGVAESVVRRMPNLATTERMKKARGGRVYVDVVQNAPEKHAVPPYVVRPTPTATVSTPLEWKEVTPKLEPKRFDVRTVLTRLGKKKDLMTPLTQTWQ